MVKVLNCGLKVYGIELQIRSFSTRIALALNDQKIDIPLNKETETIVD